MRMSKKKEIVPKFRFPEFQRDGIDFVHGNKLFKSITNKNHNSDLPILAITQDQGAVPRDQIEYNVNAELMKYVLFHEFTHILDTEMYAKKDSSKCIYLSGYTEYHASQVELMVLLGENNIRPNKFTFSLDSEIFHKKTVKDYLLQKHQLFMDMMNGKAVTMNAEKLITTLGVLYNYWGLRSVCKMYGQNYIEQIDNTPIIKEFPERMFFVADTFMEGWFDKKKVEQSFGLYSNILREYETFSVK